MLRELQLQETRLLLADDENSPDLPLGACRLKGVETELNYFMARELVLKCSTKISADEKRPKRQYRAYTSEKASALNHSQAG